MQLASCPHASAFGPCRCRTHMSTDSTRPCPHPAGLQAPAPALPTAPASAPGPAPVNPTLALEQGLLGPASPIATPCLLLKNMFDPSQEVSIDFDQEISNDVQEECSKYGSVVHVWADRNSKVGGGWGGVRECQQQA